jgi:hypothetical protein
MEYPTMAYYLAYRRTVTGYTLEQLHHELLLAWVGKGAAND